MPDHKTATREEWQAARDELAKLEAERACGDHPRGVTSAHPSRPYGRDVRALVFGSLRVDDEGLTVLDGATVRRYTWADDA